MKNRKFQYLMITRAEQIIVLVIYRDILKVSISRYFVINYCDTMTIHCH